MSRYHSTVFTASSDDHKKYNGRVTILRPLFKTEADLVDVGPMFKCQTATGETFHAFKDELSRVHKRAN